MLFTQYIVTNQHYQTEICPQGVFTRKNKNKNRIFKIKNIILLNKIPLYKKKKTKKNRKNRISKNYKWWFPLCKHLIDNTVTNLPQTSYQILSNTYTLFNTHIHLFQEKTKLWYSARVLKHFCFKYILEYVVQYCVIII